MGDISIALIFPFHFCMNLQSSLIIKSICVLSALS